MRSEEMISSERYCSSCGAANAQDAESCFACGLSLKITLPLPLEPISGNSQYLLQERYRILAQVGKGGFSAVYKAVDTLFNEHPVAIKAITLSGLKPQEVIEATEAFNREMMVLSGLKHPNLPRIYNHFSDTECWYLAMDFIEGSTLEKHLEKMLEARLPVGEALEIGLMLCSVLEYLHNRQPAIIFRDLKPANVMLRPDGRIALIDFGIARHFKPGQARDTMPFGSPGYAAPEQYGKAQATIPRSRRFALRRCNCRTSRRLPGLSHGLCRWWRWTRLKGLKVLARSNRSCNVLLTPGLCNICMACRHTVCREHKRGIDPRQQGLSRGKRLFHRPLV